MIEQNRSCVFFLTYVTLLSATIRNNNTFKFHLSHGEKEKLIFINNQKLNSEDKDLREKKLYNPDIKVKGCVTVFIFYRYIIT